MLLEAEQQRADQPSAGGVTSEDDLPRVRAAAEQPQVRAQGILDRGRERVFGRQAVLGHQHAGLSGGAQGTGQGPITEGRSRHVAATVQVHQRGRPLRRRYEQQRGDAIGVDRPDLHVRWRREPCVETRRSSARICRLSAGWDRYSRDAALPKLSSSATATNDRRCRSSIASGASGSASTFPSGRSWLSSMPLSMARSADLGMPPLMPCMHGHDAHSAFPLADMPMPRCVHDSRTAGPRADRAPNR